LIYNPSRAHTAGGLIETCFLSVLNKFLLVNDFLFVYAAALP
jgi:hypothetical protein